MSLKKSIRTLLVDKKQFKSQFELAKRFDTTPTHVRVAIRQLRNEGVAIAKLARKDPKTNRMLHAHYYVPFHSGDLDILNFAKRGRPARSDAYATSELPAGA